MHPSSSCSGGGRGKGKGKRCSGGVWHEAAMPCHNTVPSSFSHSLSPCPPCMACFMKAFLCLEIRERTESSMYVMYMYGRERYVRREGKVVRGRQRQKRKMSPLPSPSLLPQHMDTCLACHEGMDGGGAVCRFAGMSSPQEKRQVLSRERRENTRQARPQPSHCQNSFIYSF